MPDEPMTLAVALSAGLVYFLSPCVWPLYPAYVSHLAGAATGRKEPGALLVRAIGFVAGFSLVFVTLGAAASTLGQLLLSYQPLVRRLAGVLIAASGLTMLGWLKLPALNVEWRPLGMHPRPGLLGSVVMGVAFGVGWTPCVGPVLAGILALASTATTLWTGVRLLAAFATGLALPFLLVALFCERLQAQWGRWPGWGRRLHWVGRVAGALMILFGLLVYTDELSRVAAWLFYRLGA